MWTCIFSITLSRWALIARAVEHNTWAAALLLLPLMISSKTWRSRGVNVAKRDRTASGERFRSSTAINPQPPLLLTSGLSSFAHATLHGRFTSERTHCRITRLA